MNRVAALFLSVAVLGAASEARAWGWQGHRLVGRVAWAHLGEPARARSVALLRSGRDTPGLDCEDQLFAATSEETAFTGAMSWADCARSAEASELFPQFAAYHADRYPLCTGLGASACFTRHCASDVLWQALRTLKDAERSELDQRVALKMALHLMGDLHQPLHVTATGPIEVEVIVPGATSPSGFHAYWDSNVVALIEKDEKTVESVFALSTEKRAAYENGTLESWVLATHTDGQAAYAQLYAGKDLCTALSDAPVPIPAAYPEAARAIGVRKLAEGGIRLAKVLNDVLSFDGYFHAVEAEAFTAMSGVTKALTRDLGGTEYVGSIDAGDSLTYRVKLPFSGRYTLRYRVSSTAAGARFALASGAGATALARLDVPVTGDFEKWTTVEHQVELPAGELDLAVLAEAGGWRLNWIEIEGEPPAPSGTGGTGGTGGIGGTDAGAGGDITSGGAPETGGSTAAAGAMNPGGSAAAGERGVPSPSPDNDGGCSCSLGARKSVSLVWPLMLLVGLLARTRGRRGRSSRAT
jgi:hypothetical protein